MRGWILEVLGISSIAWPSRWWSTLRVGEKLWAHITPDTLASAAADRSAMFKDSFGPDDFLSVAETLQQCLKLQSCDGELRELVKHHLGWLLNMRANLQSRQMGLTKRA